MLIFEIRLTLKEPLVTTVTRTRAFISRNYVIKKSLTFQNHQKNINYFDRTPSFCITIIASKMLTFENRLPLKEPLAAIFNEKSALTSRKHAKYELYKII